MARHAADRLNASSKTDELKQFEGLLDDSRLAKEDYFFRPPRMELHCIGGFVLTLFYGLPRTTGDIDY